MGIVVESRWRQIIKILMVWVMIAMKKDGSVAGNRLTDGGRVDGGGVVRTWESLGKPTMPNARE